MHDPAMLNNVMALILSGLLATIVAVIGTWLFASRNKVSKEQMDQAIKIAETRLKVEMTSKCSNCGIAEMRSEFDGFRKSLRDLQMEIKTQCTLLATHYKLIQIIAERTKLPAQERIEIENSN